MGWCVAAPFWAGDAKRSSSGSSSSYSSGAEGSVRDRESSDGGSLEAITKAGIDVLRSLYSYLFS